MHTYFVGECCLLVHNSCTNPCGKLGGIEHQTLIGKIGDDLTQRGYKVTYEYRVTNIGGCKNTRYIDIYATKGSDRISIQVGRQTKGGLPVARERRAISDLESAGYGVLFCRIDRSKNMSKQICFLHSESDVLNYLDAIKGNNILFYTEDGLEPISDITAWTIGHMKMDSCKCLIVPSDKIISRDGINLEEKAFIEFDNCYRGNDLSRTYEVGRLYIMKNSLGKYDYSTLNAYQELVKYLKRHYVYSKTSKIYFGVDFMENYIKKYYFGTIGKVKMITF